MGIKLVRAGAAVAFLLLASVAVAFAGSSGDKRSSHSDERKSIVFQLDGKAAQDTVTVEVGDATDPRGTQYVFTNDLSRKGKKVGIDGGICTIVRFIDGASTLHCNGINELPGGQISTAGLVTYGPDEAFKKDPYYFAITGGTGKYRRARGEVRIEELGSSSVFRLTFRIVL
jgi:hypothetical protein